MTAEIKIQKAKVQLVLHQPFFASIVCRRSMTIIDDKNYTASIDWGGNIVLGRAFVDTLSVQEVIFLLAHETMHYAMMHGMRRGWRKHRAFNVSCDKVINDLLKVSGVGTPPANGVYQEGAREFTAEQLYNEHDDAGGGSGAYAAGRGNDDMSEANMPENIDAVITEIRQELAQAVQAAKVAGKMPAGLERIIDDLISPITPWHQLLERWMTGFIAADITWSRPRKALLEVGYFPSISKKPSLGTVVIIGDSSGSISAEIPHFIGHMNSILENCSPERIIFLHVDSEVHQVDEFTIDDLPLRITEIQGGGGTDMGAGLRWIEENNIDPEVCVVLTDGLTPWPDKAPTYPLAVLCTTDQDIPYGELIRYEIN